MFRVYMDVGVLVLIVLGSGVLASGVVGFIIGRKR
jgi:hypothetical protein